MVFVDGYYINFGDVPYMSLFLKFFIIIPYYHYYFYYYFWRLRQVLSLLVLICLESFTASLLFLETCSKEKW